MCLEGTSFHLPCGKYAPAFLLIFAVCALSSFQTTDMSICYTSSVEERAIPGIWLSHIFWDILWGRMIIIYNQTISNHGAEESKQMKYIH